MKKTVLRVVTVLALLVLAVGCGDGAGTEILDEPVSLPPTRVPATVASVVRPTPVSTPILPTTTASPTAGVGPALEPSPTPGAVSEEPPPLGPTPSPEESATPEGTEEPIVVIPIGQLNGEMVGQEVTVEGTVVGIESFSAGFKFTLDDGTGRTVLLMWHSVYDECWDAAGLNLGARVRVTGEVDKYEDELQVQPSWGGAVKTLAPADAWADPRPIGSLSGADEGQQVMVEGEVVRIEGSEGWVKVFVSDGSGEIAIFIWRSVLDRIPGNTGLGTPGNRVRVVGAVAVYRSNLEVVVTLPYDVTVLEVP